MRHKLLTTAIACLSLAGCTASQSSIGPDASPGWRRLELNDAGGALELFDGALESSPSAENHAGRARALFLLGRLEEARVSYDAAIALGPRDPQWRIGLAVVELACGDIRAATAACEAALEIDPRLAKGYFNRGCARLRVLEHDGALADFTQAIELDPNCAEAYNSRGVVLARTGRLDAALADFQQAARIAPLAGAHGNSAAAYYALGEVKAALSELNLALRLDRANPVHHANRGRIYLALGESDLAAADFEQALALAPSTPDLPELLARARALDGARIPQGSGVPEPAALSLPARD